MVHQHEGLSEYFKNQDLLDLLGQLHKAGFLGLVAGGAVRDALRGQEPHDYDVVTDASVEQMQELFDQTIGVGAQFGVLIVKINASQFEVAQLREESDYQDGRRPSLVKPGSLVTDAKRRDFTMNALFYNPLTFELHDYVEGVSDIRAARIRAVGDPATRFREDHLRLLRAIRFQFQLQFQIEPETRASMLSNLGLATEVSRERLLSEVSKVFLSPHFFEYASDPLWLGFLHLWLNQQSGPELKPILFKPQSQWLEIQAEGWVTLMILFLYESGLALPVLHQALSQALLKNQDKKQLNELVRGLDRAYWENLELKEQLVMSTEPLVRLAMQRVVGEGHPLLEYWREWEGEAVKGKAPEALVTAREVMSWGVKPGPQINKIVKAAYEFQLLNRLDQADSVLDCLLKSGYKINE